MIPRAINKERMEDNLIARGVTSTQFGPVHYRESKESELKSHEEILYDPNIVQSLPDILMSLRGNCNLEKKSLDLSSEY